MKSRNFLSNISFVGINKEDFYNENFVSSTKTIGNYNWLFEGRKRKLSRVEKQLITVQRCFSVRIF